MRREDWNEEDVPLSFNLFSRAPDLKSSSFPSTIVKPSNPTILEKVKRRRGKSALSSRRPRSPVRHYRSRSAVSSRPSESSSTLGPAVSRLKTVRRTHLSFAAPPTKQRTQGRTLMFIFSTSQGTLATSALRKRVLGWLGAIL